MISDDLGLSLALNNTLSPVIAGCSLCSSTFTKIGEIPSSTAFGPQGLVPLPFKGGLSSFLAKLTPLPYGLRCLQELVGDSVPALLQVHRACLLTHSSFTDPVVRAQDDAPPHSYHKGVVWAYTRGALRDKELIEGDRGPLVGTAFLGGQLGPRNSS